MKPTNHKSETRQRPNNAWQQTQRIVQEPTDGIARMNQPHSSLANGAEFFRHPTSFTDRLQFKRRSQQGGSAAEAVVVGVGVDAIEEGVGVVALVQEVGEFQTEDALLPLVLCGGIEEGHVLVLFRIRNNIMFRNRFISVLLPIAR